jgi:hypothetical protein
MSSVRLRPNTACNEIGLRNDFAQAYLGSCVVSEGLFQRNRQHGDIAVIGQSQALHGLCAVQRK